METKESRTGKLLLAAALVLTTQSAVAIGLTAGVPRHASTRAIFEKNIDLTTAVIRTFGGAKRFPEIVGGAAISANLDVKENVVVIDLGAEYLQVAESPDMEDFQREITAILFDALGNPPEWRGVELKFGGIELRALSPDTSAFRRAKRSPSGAAQNPDTDSPRLLIAAGHGFYFNHKYGDWRPQRDVSNGILEDDITQDFADVAKEWVERWVPGSSRSVVIARSLSADLHAGSDQPWRRMAARYWVKERFPELETLWSERGGASNGDRERIQDLYSRPILANHVGALAAVHLHTNASSNPDRSGLQLYYQKGAPEAEEFGKRILCQLSRSIGYKHQEYNVPLIPLPGDYAELRGSKMPAVIVELGFHTNPGDARILQSSKFKDAVASAIDRGFTYQIDDMPCGPLTVTDFKYERFFPAEDSLPIAKVSFSYAREPGERKPIELRLQIKQDGVCKRTLTDYRVDDIWYENIRPKPGTVIAGVSCDSPFTDEPVVVNLLSQDQLLWSQKMKLTCPYVYPIEFCGCDFCPPDPEE